MAKAKPESSHEVEPEDIDMGWSDAVYFALKAASNDNHKR